MSGSLDELAVLTQWAYPNRLYSAAKFCAETKNAEFVQLNSFGCGPDAITIDEINDILQESGKHPTTVRIDEISSQGSIKLRLRTMAESFKLASKSEKKERKTTPPYLIKDRKRKLFLPFFSEFHSHFTEATFNSLGFETIMLPPPDEEALQLGLKYTNNEICYPAILVIGTILKQVFQGKYKREEITIGISQTGGQCRASAYLSLVRKALVSAGFDDIPVISVTASSKKLNYQPGFKINQFDFLKRGFFSVLFGDALSLMYHSTAVREKEKGASKALVDKYINIAKDSVGKSNFTALLLFLEQAVAEFNKIPVYEGNYPKIGLVGEIYVKYSDFGNHGVVDWLMNEGVEVVVPPLTDFFIQETFNIQYNKKHHLEDRTFLWLGSFLAEKYLLRFVHGVDEILKNFSRYREQPDIKTLAAKAEKVLSLSNQYGEGWLIAGEISAMAEEGVESILCLQPFGCIANQIVAKGVEKKMKDIYPGLKILFIDLDHDTSKANFTNRLHFLASAAKDTAAAL